MDLIKAVRNCKVDRVEKLANSSNVNFYLERDNSGPGATKKKILCPTALHIASNNGHHEIIDILLKFEGIDVNIKSAYGDTPLHRACCHGCEEVVKKLLAFKNIDVNATDNDGWSPLMMAIGFEKYEVAKLLIQHPNTNFDMEITVESKSGFGVGSTAIDIAKKKGCTEIIELIEVARRK